MQGQGVLQARAHCSCLLPPPLLGRSCCCLRRSRRPTGNLFRHALPAEPQIEPVSEVTCLQRLTSLELDLNLLLERVRCLGCSMVCWLCCTECSVSHCAAPALHPCHLQHGSLPVGNFITVAVRRLTALQHVCLRANVPEPALEALSGTLLCLPMPLAACLCCLGWAIEQCAVLISSPAAPPPPASRPHSADCIGAVERPGFRHAHAAGAARFACPAAFDFVRLHSDLCCCGRSARFARGRGRPAIFARGRGRMADTAARPHLPVAAECKTAEVRLGQMQMDHQCRCISTGSSPRSASIQGASCLRPPCPQPRHMGGAGH